MTLPWNRLIYAYDPHAAEKLRQAGEEARILNRTIYNLSCSLHGIIAQALLAEDSIDEIEGSHRSQEGCTGLIRLVEAR